MEAEMELEVGLELELELDLDLDESPVPAQVAILSRTQTRKFPLLARTNVGSHYERHPALPGTRKPLWLALVCGPPRGKVCARQMGYFRSALGFTFSCWLSVLLFLWSAYDFWREEKGSRVASGDSDSEATTQDTQLLLSIIIPGVWGLCAALDVSQTHSPPHFCSSQRRTLHCGDAFALQCLCRGEFIYLFV
jgi:hypothetical protein